MEQRPEIDERIGRGAADDQRRSRTFPPLGAQSRIGPVAMVAVAVGAIVATLLFFLIFLW